MTPRIAFLAVLALSAPAAMARADCARAVVQSLADERLDELAKRFADDSPRLKADLQALYRMTGRLTRLEPTSIPRPGGSVPKTVARTGLPASYTYTGFWFNADSSKLGPVQFHLAVVPGSACELFALHMNRLVQP